jgi:hypothetical protein
MKQKEAASEIMKQKKAASSFFFLNSRLKNTVNHLFAVENTSRFLCFF